MISVLCTVPIRDYPGPEISITSDTLQVTKTISDEQVDSIVPVKIPIDQWVGMDVFVLEKPEVFRKHGYEFFFLQRVGFL